MVGVAIQPPWLVVVRRGRVHSPAASRPFRRPQASWWLVGWWWRAQNPQRTIAGLATSSPQPTQRGRLGARRALRWDELVMGHRFLDREDRG